MQAPISSNTMRSLKASYKNILAYVLQETNTCEYQLNCLSKWGAQLGYRQAELHRMINAPGLTKYEAPASSTDALAQVYDMVYMVYMDGVIEDIELEVVSAFATGVGLEAFVVNNLLKALISAQIDGLPNEAIRSDIKIHPEVYV